MWKVTRPTPGNRLMILKQSKFLWHSTVELRPIIPSEMTPSLHRKQIKSDSAALLLFLTTKIFTVLSSFKRTIVDLRGFMRHFLWRILVFAYLIILSSSESSTYLQLSYSSTVIHPPSIRLPNLNNSISELERKMYSDLICLIQLSQFLIKFCILFADFSKLLFTWSSFWMTEQLKTNFF